MTISAAVFLACAILGALLILFALLAFVADELLTPWIERRRLARIRRELDEAYEEATRRG